MVLDTIFVTSTRSTFESGADIRIYAAHRTPDGVPNTKEENLINARTCGTFGYQEQFFTESTRQRRTLLSSIWMPRAWALDEDRTRRQLMKTVPDWTEGAALPIFSCSSNPLVHCSYVFYYGLVHELGHYLFSFQDEYSCPTNNCYSDPSSARLILGLMMMGNSDVSEMSSEPDYVANNSFKNNDQYHNCGSSCWSRFEQIYEGTSISYPRLNGAGLHIVSPNVAKVGEYQPIVDRGERLDGPNGDSNYGNGALENVGSNVIFSA